MDWLIFYFGFGLVMALLSYQIGKSKGRGLQGFVLGFWFSFIGLVVTALLPPTREKAAADRAEFVEQMRSAVTPTIGTRSIESFREEALRKALAEDESLKRDDPETLARLSQRTEYLMQMLQLKHERDIVDAKLQAEQRKDDEAAMARRQQEEQQQRAVLAAEEAALLAIQQERQRQELIASYSPARRFFIQNRTLVLSIVAAITLVGLGAVGLQIKQQRDAQAAREIAFRDCTWFTNPDLGFDDQFEVLFLGYSWHSLAYEDAATKALRDTKTYLSPEEYAEFRRQGTLQLQTAREFFKTMESRMEVVRNERKDLRIGEQYVEVDVLKNRKLYFESEKSTPLYKKYTSLHDELISNGMKLNPYCLKLQ